MSTSFECIYTTVQDSVGTITINRPDVRNALNGQVVVEMERALAQFEQAEDVGVVVFTGCGEKSFASGADIGQLRERTFRDALSARMQRLYDAIETFPKPTIASVNGYALGGGCELAMSCDIRIAARHAKFGLPELNLGIIPGAGGTQRLGRLVGKGRALELILTGRMVEGEEALRMGLVNQIVDGPDLAEASYRMASAMLCKGPVALRLAKLAVQAGLETDQRTGLLLERLAQAVLFTTEDKVEGTTAFLEKRKPEFQNR